VNIKPSIFLAAGLLIGAGAGYFIGVERARKEFNHKLETEVAETITEFKETYKADLLAKQVDPDLGKTAESESTPEEKGHTGAAFGIGQPVTAEGGPRVDYAAKSKKKQKETIQLPNNSIKPGVNIVLNEPLGDDPTEWNRSADEPYVISIAEYMENGKDQDSQTLRYWSDNTLTDDVDYTKGQDVGVYTDARADEMIGLKNLKYFGMGSQVDDIVYIRNERIRMDFEVERQHESYADVVLGISPHDFADGKAF